MPPLVVGFYKNILEKNSSKNIIDLKSDFLCFWYSSKRKKWFSDILTLSRNFAISKVDCTGEEEEDGEREEEEEEEVEEEEEEEEEEDDDSD